MTDAIRFILNGDDITLTSVRPTETLLDYLRLQRRLTGTKEGCAEGDCGACTVLVGRLVDGVLVYESVNACIRFLASLHGTHVVTVEHLAGANGALHPIQQAMVDCHGSQCGFCTPGFVMSLYGLWLSTEKPTRADIERALQGNLCRCTGYEPIIRAAEQVSAARPSSIFDPLERNRTDILARLWNADAAQKHRSRRHRPDGDGRIGPRSRAWQGQLRAGRLSYDVHDSDAGTESGKLGARHAPVRGWRNPVGKFSGAWRHRQIEAGTGPGQAAWFSAMRRLRSAVTPARSGFDVPSDETRSRAAPERSKM